MMEELRRSFQAARHQVSGHGKRNVGVLKDALLNVADETRSDIYGNGAVINDFEQKIAALLGHESAVFFPSGTMAQQIALRIWSDDRDNRHVAYHPLCHLELHEQDGLRQLHPIEPVLVGRPDEMMTLEEIKALPEIACLLLELPNRELGGVAPTFSELEAIVAYCRERGIRLHLDGARLLELLPYYDKPASDVASLFDSVYLSFYKGIGGIAGAILAGPKSFTTEARVWKRRYGGDLISLYPYVISSDYYYEQRKDRMGHYYEQAKHVAERLNAIDNIFTTPRVPVSNMFHLHFNGEVADVAARLTRIQDEVGLGLVGYLVEHDGYFSTEISFGDAFDAVSNDAFDELIARLSTDFSA
ncbi:threonine aldolase family protein [Exiguobacterium oxidotolerans]|uniref:threonine aldolase family protein n=1 Tax=Exiguobacterium oxidotolerans TaxID=223958 RepID=UPI00049420BA|nr:beta-eliminating lyase-related protein [Exiguobacterium oxidotolerans]